MFPGEVPHDAHQREPYAADSQGQERLSGRTAKYQRKRTFCPFGRQAQKRLPIFNPCGISKRNTQNLPQSIQNSVAPISEYNARFRLCFHNLAQGHAKL